MTGFADEETAKTRHFFTHLQMHSKGPIVFGQGDFNLGYTRDWPVQDWVAELSTDAAGGGGVSPSNVTREGFVAAVRYGPTTKSLESDRER
jgi:hypothetical protein